MSKINWHTRWFSILLTGFVFSMTLDPDSMNSSAYLIISLGLFVTFTSYLLLPTPDSTGYLLANTVAAVAALIILIQLPSAGSIPLQVLLQVSAITLCLSLFLWSLHQLLIASTTNMPELRKAVLLFSIYIISVPVWSGPLVDIYQPDSFTINTLISITPLTHFSVAAEYDYLRSEWFYQNTPFGSLPFNYPSFISIIMTYLLFIFVMQIIRHWLTQSNNDQTKTPKHSLNIA